MVLGIPLCLPVGFIYSTPQNTVDATPSFQYGIKTVGNASVDARVYGYRKRKPENLL